MSKKVGVFLCRCGGNISQVVDLDQLKEFAENTDDVVMAEYQSFTCSSEGQGVIQKAINEKGLDSVVIGCCTPKQYEELYRECISETGLNPYMLEMVNLREQVSYPHHHEPEKATEKGIKLLNAAINKVKLLQPLEVKKAKVNTNVAVIGGGIAGVNSSMMLAKMGYKVNLIEREPSIGGNMAKLVKTFPTDDCAMCTLSPKIDEVGKHKNINLLAYSEIQDIKKTPEGLKLQVLRKARYVIDDKCTGCGKCDEVCPVSIHNDYNLGLKSEKKVAYRQFASAVPNIYTIQKQAIAPCKSTCPVNQSAQGYIALTAAKRYEEAFNVIYRDNPLPSVCGRVCNHECETACTRTDVDGAVAIRAIKRFCADYAVDNDIKPKIPLVVKKDKSIGVIGGGPSGIGCAHRLASKGYQVTIYEKNKRAGGMLAYGIPSYRLPDKYLDADLDYLKLMGVEIKTQTTVGQDISFKEIYKANDAVYISTGLQEMAKLPQLPGSDLNGIYQGGDILYQIRNDQPFTAKKNGVVIGGGNVAIDVARTLNRLGAEKITLVCLEEYDKMPAIRSEITEAENEGIIIKTGLSTSRFMGSGTDVEGIEVKKVDRIDILDDGRFVPVLVDGSETTIACDEVFVAIGQRADLSFLTEEFTPEFDQRGLLKTDSPESTYTGKEKIFGGGDLTTGASTVIGGVAIGQTAAEEIDCYLSGTVYLGKELPYQNLEYDKQEILKSKEGQYEPAPRNEIPEISLDDRTDFTEVEACLSEEIAIAEAQRCLQCGDCSDCRACEIACEAEAIDLFQKDRVEEIEVGAVVVATGFKEFDPSNLHYGYDKYPDVVTQLQFARMLDPMGPTDGTVVRASNNKPAKKIVMVQCAGSRSGETGAEGTHQYCSRVCCMVALKHAGLVKKYFDPEVEIYICYIDIRAFGKGYEEYFEQVKGMGVKFIKGLPGSVNQDPETGKMMVTVDDANTNTLLEIDADLVVLSAATEPSDNQDLIRQLNISKDESGFVKEFHQKIRPTDTMVKNIFVCGAAQSPKDIPDTIAQAGSAAASVAAYLGDGYVTLNPMIANVNEELCRACGRCEEGCEYSAISVDSETLSAKVVPAMCEGCGKCSVLCPTGAASVFSSTNDQINAMLDGMKMERAE
jgi:heterodisulfide reductase subunit A2